MEYNSDNDTALSHVISLDETSAHDELRSRATPVSDYMTSQAGSGGGAPEIGEGGGDGIRSVIFCFFENANEHHCHVNLDIDQFDPLSLIIKHKYLYQLELNTDDQT